MSSRSGGGGAPSPRPTARQIMVCGRSRRRVKSRRGHVAAATAALSGAEAPPDVLWAGRRPGRRGTADACCRAPIGGRSSQSACRSRQSICSQGDGTPSGRISSRSWRCTTRSQNSGLKQVSETILRDQTRCATTAPAAVRVPLRATTQRLPYAYGKR